MTKTLKKYLTIDDTQMKRYEQIYTRYRKLYTDPDNCEPMFIINTPVEQHSTIREDLENPLLSLRKQLDNIKAHAEVGDDYVPAVRVQFGTAQVAAAFGCDLHIFEDSLPAAANHACKTIEDVYSLQIPSLDAGWYGKLKHTTEIFLENLPEGVHIQHPDIQSAFNSAHLIRGNDILLDFYDEPDAVDTLLGKVTDYMIKLVPHLKQMISDDKEWFFDSGALWRGTARISNCTMHLISPQLYKDFVLKHDMRLMSEISKGRIHYCGTHGEVINEFFKNPDVTGLDFDANHHNLWDVASKSPKRLVLHQWADPIEGIKPTIERLLKGEWPIKKNIIIQTNANSVEEGKELLKRLRESVKVHNRILVK